MSSAILKVHEARSISPPLSSLSWHCIVALRRIPLSVALPCTPPLTSERCLLVTFFTTKLLRRPTSQRSLLLDLGVMLAFAAR